MAWHALPDQTASARPLDLALVVAGMLVDIELTRLALVALTRAVLVQVAADSHRSGVLPEPLVAAAPANTVHPDLPGPVLPEFDTRNALGWVGRVKGRVAPRLCRRHRTADDIRLAALKPDQQAQVVPLVRFVVIRGAVQVHPLDVGDIHLAWAAVDLVTLALHGGDDEMGQIRPDPLRRRNGNGGRRARDRWTRN